MATINQVLNSFSHPTAYSSFFTRIKAIFITRVKMALNYKSSYLMVVLLNLVTIFIYFFYGKLNPNLSVFGINAAYFEFVFIGLSLQMLIGTTLSTVNGGIHQEILTGTWSHTLLHFNFIEYAIGTALAGAFLSSFSILAALIVSQFFLGLQIVFSLFQIIMIFLLLILLIISHITISMLFSAFIIWYKRDNGLVSLIYQLTKTFSGVVFPIALLSGFPLFISKILPLTYGLQSMQMVIFNPGEDFTIVLLNALFLLGFTVIIGYISWILTKISIRNSKIKGTVDDY